MRLELCLARDDERRRRLPGDDLVGEPKETIAHAITINATPQAYGVAGEKGFRE
jgi:hypothetical protein